MYVAKLEVDVRVRVSVRSIVWLLDGVSDTVRIGVRVGVCVEESEGVDERNGVNVVEMVTGRVCDGDDVGDVEARVSVAVAVVEDEGVSVIVSERL